MFELKGLRFVRLYGCMVVHVWIVIVWWFAFGTLILLFSTLECLVLWLLLSTMEIGSVQAGGVIV